MKILTAEISPVIHMLVSEMRADIVTGDSWLSNSTFFDLSRNLGVCLTYKTD